MLISGKMKSKLHKIIFHGNDTNFEILWRISSGKYRKAFYICKGHAERGGIDDFTEEDFINVCAEANDGIEVEWLE